jgi:hypothetical protein
MKNEKKVGDSPADSFKKKIKMDRAEATQGLI